MKIIGEKQILDFCKKHNQAKSGMMSWIAEVRAANWKTPQDIKNRFVTASFLADNRVIFNIKGNSYRLVVQVRYVNGIVKIENVMTHPEYDKLRLK